jgi:hypothetical protein
VADATEVLLRRHLGDLEAVRPGPPPRRSSGYIVRMLNRLAEAAVASIEGVKTPPGGWRHELGEARHDGPCLPTAAELGG